MVPLAVLQSILVAAVLIGAAAAIFCICRLISDWAYRRRHR